MNGAIRAVGALKLPLRVWTRPRFSTHIRHFLRRQNLLQDGGDDGDDGVVVMVMAMMVMVMMDPPSPLHSYTPLFTLSKLSSAR